MFETGAFVRGLVILAAAVSLLGWLLWRSIKKSADPVGMLARLIITAIIVGGGYHLIGTTAGPGDEAGQIAGVLMGAVLGLCLAVLWVPTIAGKVGDWFGNLYTGGGAPPEPQAFYSIAESRRKQGKYREAVYEIQRQLAQFPHDVTSQMMLAEIQAENLNDLSAAELTIDRFCRQPGHAPQNIAFALNSLADWHLKFTQDPEAARLALQRVIDLLPDTEQSQTAAQRIAHLASREALVAAHEHHPIHLPQGPVDRGLMKNPPPIARPELSPEDEADRLAKHLGQHPLDTEARERLALLYVEGFQRADLAADQLEQLIAAPNVPGKDKARWINQLADVQLAHGADYETIRGTLQRAVDLFPGLAAARLAQQRIEILRLELKGKEQGHVVQLGAYEKDLGLKQKRSPPAPPRIDSKMD